MSVGNPLQVQAAVRSGVLLSGQPYLTEPAWVRRHAGHDADYSLVGSIFAYSSPPHREQMMHSALAPVQPWDALICSSPTLRQTVVTTFDSWEEHLRDRLGATGLPRPQLPVIPFGCDVEQVGAQSRDEGRRASWRARIGAGPQDVVVYFLGRLSYYDKAFPQPMLKAVAEAAQRTGVPTHFVMTGWFPAGDEDRQRYASAAERHAPNVPVTFLDGNDKDLVAGGWAGADVFLLLSDTIIETFGQAIVEAMAAGLPVVASDWDGYRFIVSDGDEGFLIPTLGAPAGPLGRTLALMESLQMMSYPVFAGTVAEHTAVDVGQAAARLADLLGSAQLRQRLGDAGRRQAAQRFSWPVVAQQYWELFAELDARRAAEAAIGPAMNPLRDDPFSDFRGLPSQTLGEDTVLSLTGRVASFDQFDDLFASVRGSREETQQVLEVLASGPCPLGELLPHFPAARRPFIRLSVMWLAKSGVISWM